MASQVLAEVEQTRLALAQSTDPRRKSRLGQFLTPAPIAQFMAGLFAEPFPQQCRLLDAGAGIGALTAALLDLCVARQLDHAFIEVDAFELDTLLHPFLHETLQRYENRLNVQARVRGDDFIDAASDSLHQSMFAEQLPKYTHAILNPPYKKIRSDSAHRAALRRVGIETVNLYSAFVALSLALLEDQGQLVAIIPRSFCNGPYYRPFREFILNRAALQRIHLFDSRQLAFKDDRVLQENIIIHLQRGALQGSVTVSTSTDAAFSDVAAHNYPWQRIVNSSDPERFIHVPTFPETDPLGRLSEVGCSLADLGIQVSTGPVVDFRLKRHLRNDPEQGAVPLLYPGHFPGCVADWPNPKLKKPNAICRNSETERWLFPNGHYCIVRRFSAKEEKRRLRASVCAPEQFPGFDALGFENHLNVFHQRKQGLSAELAFGLAAYLNTTVVDVHFRCFSGHTQVNATDLRSMKFPPRKCLMALGEWAMRQEERKQAELDRQFARLTA